MRYFLELSKEYGDLPSAEITSCLEANNISFLTFCSTRDIFGFQTSATEKMIQQVANRISFAYMLNTFFFDCPINDDKTLIQRATEHPPRTKGSLVVRYRNRSETVDSQQIVEKLASIYAKHRKVSLHKPDNEIRVLITPNRIYVGQRIAKIHREQFEQRKAQYRPFFSPISLHPKIARALVNLSQVSIGQTVYDPFCGTGGILIEAGLIGARIIGSDVSTKMVEGTEKNLSFYKLKPEKLFTTDIGEITQYIDRKVDVVVTDFPYGKATTTMGESLDRLYARAFESIYEILKPGGRAVLGLPSKDIIQTVKNYFLLKATFAIPVHRSLTRYFSVLEKQP